MSMKQHLARLLKFYSTSSRCVLYQSQKGFDPNWGSKKHQEKRSIKLGVKYESLREDFEEIERKLEPLKTSIKTQGDIVRKLKTDGASEFEIRDAVQKLQVHKKELEKMTDMLLPSESFDRARMNDLIKRRFFYNVSFHIYGGIAGQFDFGPLGCQIIDNILAEWHKHFVVRERMMKVQASTLTPEAVLRASGHLARFTDVVVQDEKTKESFRLDHLIKENLENQLGKRKLTEDERTEIGKKILLLESLSMEEMGTLAKELNLRSPSTGNPLSSPKEQNLMFPVSIGPSGAKGYLRPETSQGVFVNFRKLLDLRKEKLPFACAQVGTAYRNEIEPQSGLLRVREFQMAEIQHFCLPHEKNHPKFRQISETKLWLFSACDQRDGKKPKLMSIGDAVQKGLVANETLGFYMARTQHFLLRIGVAAPKLRFRQHLGMEMAHYAKDCWDAECLTSYGWVECAGLADRAAFDLKRHAEATGVDLCVELSPDSSECPDMGVGRTQKVYPSVIEPSFGIGRIFYTLLEHNFRIREDNTMRAFFSLPPVVAPVKVAVLPVINKPSLENVVQSVADALTDVDLSVWVDEWKGTVGRKYVQMDEWAVPFAVTVDEETLTSSPSTVTLRERDSTKQVRITVEAVPSTVKDLSEGKLKWDDVVATWPNIKVKDGL